MKILVCISKTPDTTAKIAFSDNNTKFATDGVQWIINPYDEWYSLVRAIELKEADPSISISLIHVGNADSDPIIRKAFALGGDDGFRVNSESNDSYFVAAQIAHVAKQGNYDLVLTGKETIDYNSASIGGLLAEMLEVPYVALATQLISKDGKLEVTREIEGGQETDLLPIPAVISCQKGMAEQRIPNMKGIMAARTKPLQVTEPVAADNLTSIVSFELPAAKAGVKLISPEQPEELVRILHEEARVI